MPSTRTQPGMTFKLTVEGKPVPQGSMKAMMNEHMKFPVIISDNPELKAWRKLVSDLARLEMRKQDYVPCGRNVPVRIIADFYFERPKSVKALDKTTAPDLDKLCRSLLDSLTGIVYEDDAQVTEIQARKCYGSPARLEVELQEADWPPASLLSHQTNCAKSLPF